MNTTLPFCTLGAAIRVVLALLEMRLFCVVRAVGRAPSIEFSSDARPRLHIAIVVGGASILHDHQERLQGAVNVVTGCDLEMVVRSPESGGGSLGDELTHPSRTLPDTEQPNQGRPVKTTAIVASRRNDDHYLIAASYEGGNLTVASRAISIRWSLDSAVSDATEYEAEGNRPSLAVAIEALECDPTEVINAVRPEYIGEEDDANQETYLRDADYSRWMTRHALWKTEVPAVRVGPNWRAGFSMGRNMPPPIVIAQPDYKSGLKALIKAVEAAHSVAKVARTALAAPPTHYTLRDDDECRPGVRVETWTIHGRNWSIADVPVVAFDDGEIALSPDEGSWR